MATPETEGEWLEAARGQTCTVVREMVAGRAPGDVPSDAPRAEVETRRLVHEVRPEVYALCREARRLAGERMGGPVDDSAFLEGVLMAFLQGGERDPGKAAFQVALTVGPEGRVTMAAGGEVVPVDEATVAMARCDATEIGGVDADDRAPRATQTVPPRVRRQVLARHEGRCAVPGCRNAILHVHHVVARADGGTHDPDNLCPLCSAHHRAAHDGALVIEGSFREGLSFRHADGRAYGTATTALGARRVLAEAFEALVGMGWKEREARSLVDGVRGEVEAAAEVPDRERVVRRALRLAAVPCAREELAEYQRVA